MPLPPLDARMALIAEHWFGVEMPDPAPAPVGVVVGERPGPRSSPNPHFAMWPWPPTSAGGRLLHMSGLDVPTYLTRLHRANLVAEPIGRWNKRAAMDRAVGLYQSLRAPNGVAKDDWTRLVLCGVRVAEAFGFDSVEWFRPVDRGGLSYVVVPHPSGRNRAYNDETNRRLAGQAVRWAARLP